MKRLGVDPRGIGEDPEGIGKERSVSRREALRITALAGVAVGLGTAGLRELFRSGRLRRVWASHIRMGTPVTLTVVSPEGEAARGWIASAFAEMARLEGIFSRHDPAAALARLNRNGVLPQAPAELTALLSRSLAWARRTKGAFDPTVAPLLDLYRSAAGTGRVPGREEVEAARQKIDFRTVRVEEGFVRLESPGSALTLDGIAKGHIVDRTAALLQSLGAERVLVNAGGDLSSRGRTVGEEPWTVGLPDPSDPVGMRGAVALTGQAVASSGGYLQRLSPDGKIHHILDPRTGRSPAESLALTVVAPDAETADVLSTAALILGPETGRRLLEATPDAEGLFLMPDGGELETPGFHRYRG